MVLSLVSIPFLANAQLQGIYTDQIIDFEPSVLSVIEGSVDGVTITWVNGELVWDATDVSYSLLREAIHEAHLGGLEIENGYEQWGWDAPHWQIKDWKEYI